MNLQSQAFRFHRPERGSRPLPCKASTDALAVVFVWQMLAPCRSHELLSLSDGEFLIACLTFLADDAPQATKDLQDQCMAHDLVVHEVEVDTAPSGSRRRSS